MKGLIRLLAGLAFGLVLASTIARAAPPVLSGHYSTTYWGTQFRTTITIERVAGDQVLLRLVGHKNNADLSIGAPFSQELTGTLRDGRLHIVTEAGSIYDLVVGDGTLTGSYVGSGQNIPNITFSR